ncbi:hypothetical protein CLU79DRAFT_17419 [Phycomyces nitens]|nr:hypothetical protein CLU79DRAFT_17419 [Phycomyces nitens]
MPEEFYSDMRIVNNGWRVVSLPGTLVIDSNRGFTKVYFCHDSTSNCSKAGLELDWVRLVLILDEPEYEASRMYTRMDGYNRAVRIPDVLTLRFFYEYNVVKQQQEVRNTNHRNITNQNTTNRDITNRDITNRDITNIHITDLDVVFAHLRADSVN